MKLAKDLPEAADLQQLWVSLEQTLAPLKTQAQLQLAGDAIAQFAGIVGERLLLSLEEIDSMMQEDGPVLSVDFFDSFIRQSMHVDLAQFIEPPPPLPRILPQRQRQKFPNDGRSIVVVVDKVALLKSLETEPDDETAKAKALAVAHDEDISAWVEAIAHYFRNSQVKSLPLVELVRGVQYPFVEGEEERLPLIKTWLALLLGGFKMEQGDNFYSLKGIFVEIP